MYTCTINSVFEDLTMTTKKRAVISYANMSDELLDIWKERFPRGYADYMDEIMKIDKADGSFFYAVPFEVPDAIYLVKVDVRIEEYDEVEKDIFGSGEDDSDDETPAADEFPETDDANFVDAEEEEPEDD